VIAAAAGPEWWPGPRKLIEPHQPGPPRTEKRQVPVVPATRSLALPSDAPAGSGAPARSWRSLACVPRCAALTSGPAVSLPDHPFRQSPARPNWRADKYPIARCTGVETALS